MFVLCLVMSSYLVGCSGEGEHYEDDEERVTEYSEGLEYILSEDRTYMILSGIGSCNDTTISIPPTYNELPVKEIREGAFRPASHEGTPNIKKIIIPDSIVSINEDAFRSCEHLTEIHIGRGVKEIAGNVFYNCGEHLNVYIKDMAAFCEIKFPGGSIVGVGKCDYNLYLNNKLVEELIIPDTVTNIGRSVFGGCSSIKKVVLGKSVVSIDSYAFSKCKNLSEITFNNSLSCIKEGAFANCNVLLKATFKNTDNWTVTSYKDSISLSSSELAKESTAAKYLANDYSDFEWTRK